MGTCDGAAGGRAWVVAMLLWMLQSTAAGSLDKHSNARMQSCFAAGKLLDLTNGSVGLPNCVERCVPPAERSVQAEGLGFCMLPVVRTEAFDVSFTLELRNVSLKHLPSPEQLRTQVPVALGQALQVPPADVLGEVMVRDSSSYDSHTLHSFKLRRRDETDEPGDEPTEIPPKVSKHLGMSSMSGRNQSAKTGSGGGKEKDSLVGVRGKPKHPGPAFSPCRSGFCNMYLTMRCEVWRIASAPGVELPDSSLMTALQQRSPEEVIEKLGLSGNWSVLQFSTATRPKGSTPLEIVRADPVFRFLGLPWNYDPLQGNLTGKWSEFGGLDPRFKYEEKAMEQILIAFFVLIALAFAIVGQQKLVPLSSVNYSDSADWQSVGGMQNRTFRRPWPMRKETRKMLGLRTA